MTGEKYSVNDPKLWDTGDKNYPKSNSFLCKNVRPTDYIQFYEDPEISDVLRIDLDKCNPFQKLIEIGDKNAKKNSRRLELSRPETPPGHSGKIFKFEKIFFKPEFNSNDTVSRYMLLDKLIKNAINTYLITYGYSGVGKSFTLFGTPTIPGLLQSTIGNVEGYKSIDLRVYELYGLGVGYSDTWVNYKNIDQCILHYNTKLNSSYKSIELDSDVKALPIRGDYIPKYLKQIYNYKKSNNVPKDMCGVQGVEYFLKMGGQAKTYLNKFQKFVDVIEADRREPSEGGEIKIGPEKGLKKPLPSKVKPTVNNPNSSRAKLLYEFIFNFGDKTSSFIIDDTPGAENLLESYINTNENTSFYKKLSMKKQFNEMKMKKSSLEEIKEKLNVDEEPQFTTTETWQQAMMHACLVSPMYLALLAPLGVINGLYN